MKKRSFAIERLDSASCNIALTIARILAGNVPLSGMSDTEKTDTRFCKNCGGSRREHGIYGTPYHIPDLDKPLDGYSIATAFCDKFNPE